MSEHIERMKVEYNELTDRVIKLGEFIYSSKTYDTLPRDERVRMAQQYGLMRSYMNILNERLLAAKITFRS